MEERAARNDGRPDVKGIRRPIEDPRARLSPTALRLLEATRKIIVEEGFAMLTLSRISEVSGERNVAAVKYYFGSKSGLVSVVLDTVLYDVMSTLDDPTNETLSTQGLRDLTVQTAIVNQPSDALRILFEMLPHVLRDKDLAGRLHVYYEAFHHLHLSQLHAEMTALEEDQASTRKPDATLEGLACLLSAIGDGLSIQAMVQPDHFDFAETLAALDLLIRHALPHVSGPAQR